MFNGSPHVCAHFCSQRQLGAPAAESSASNCTSSMERSALRSAEKAAKPAFASLKSDRCVMVAAWVVAETFAALEARPPMDGDDDSSNRASNRIFP